MRITHIIGSLDPQHGGPPKIAACIAAGQALLGNDVRLITQRDAGREGDIQKMLDSIPGIDRVQIEMLDRISPLKQIFFKTPNPRLPEHIQWAEAVHVHSVWDGLNIPTTQLAKQHGVPYFILLNGMLDPWSLSQKPIKKKIFLALRYRAMLNHSAALHLGNRDEERLIKPLGLTAKNVLIPNGVYPDEIKPPETVEPVYEAFEFLRGKPFMLFMGRLHYKKGLDITAEAFAEFAKTNEDVQLVIAGPDGGAGDDLKQRITSHQLSDRVHVIGPVYGDLKWQLLHAADCFVLTTRQEGFSVAVTEALGCGLPCIVSEDCHYPEVAEAHAGFVTPLTIDASAKAMSEMFNAEHNRQQMSANARQLVLDRFTWPKIAEQCLKVYRGSLS